jgi:hypothetical protein
MSGWLLSLFLGAASGPVTPTISEPAWLVAPTTNDENLVACPGVTFDRSNNNVGIALFGDRLYVAVRSAPHHHPHPPAWAAHRTGTTRLYVISTAFGPAERERVLRRWPEAWKALPWRLEFEAAQRLDREQLQPLRDALTNPSPETRQAAVRDVARLLGAGVAEKVADPTGPAAWTGYLRDHDLREPLFFVLQGRLHFLFLSIAGVAHRFEVLRAWHTELTADGRWERIQPILAPGDHYWEVLVPPRPADQVAYLSLYHGGGHYSFQDTVEGLIDLRRSSDGRKWVSVHPDGAIDRGRGCEPALAFAADGRAWMLLRLEDADRRGWGSLLGEAETAHLDRWTLARRADPQRFDGARFLVQGPDLYLVARQNVGTDAAGKLVETRNQPYGPSDGASEAGNLRSLGLMTGYGLTPKRTALYWLDPQAKRLRWLRTLPSAGDTAFPSLVRLAPDVVLLANYSSPVEERKLSWLEGQNRRTGIYLMLLRFPAKR